MKISLIVAMSENRAIGLSGQLIWHLPNDLKHFKAITMGKPIVMGRTTYESIGKPLPGRTNIVLTHQRDYQAPGCIVLHDKASVLSFCQEYDEVMIIGGARIYELFLPDVTRIYLTAVHAVCEGDTYFPELNTSNWEAVAREDYTQDDKHRYDFSFIELVKASQNT